MSKIMVLRDWVW